MSPAFEPPPPAAESTRVPEPLPETPPPAVTDPQPDDTASDVGAVLGLNSGDRRVLMVMVCTALVLMSVHWYRLTQHRPQPIEVIRAAGYHFELDVNSATWVEWMQLERIGETLARRIVEDRQQRGPFQSVDDVQRVKGIGPKTLEGLRPHLTCSQPADAP